MPLLAINASKKVTITCSLEESTAKMIDRYAAFLNVSADEVVDKGMEYIFTKDKDFQQHLEKQTDVQVPASLRIKKTPGTPTAMKNGNRHGAKSVASDAK